MDVVLFRLVLASAKEFETTARPKITFAPARAKAREAKLVAAPATGPPEAAAAAVAWREAARWQNTRQRAASAARSQAAPTCPEVRASPGALSAASAAIPASTILRTAPGDLRAASRAIRDAASTALPAAAGILLLGRACRSSCANAFVVSVGVFAQ